MSPRQGPFKLKTKDFLNSITQSLIMIMKISENNFCRILKSKEMLNSKLPIISLFPLTILRKEVLKSKQRK